MIKVENLTKYYGERLAVDNISFNIEKGEIVGFLGPNAAGKTTTMRILTGYLAPTSGDAWVAGYNVASNSIEARRSLGYFAESVPFYGDMTVRSYLSYLGTIRGMDKKKIKKRTDDVVEICHLEDYVDVFVGRLSRGFRQRVGIAQSILHEPDVLIMDEPTVGIDPKQVSMTRNLIKDLGEDRTILLSTHILPEVSMICERVIIIHQGNIVAQDKIENLSSIVSGNKRFRIEIEGPSKEIIASLSKIEGISDITYSGYVYSVESVGEKDPRPQINAAILNGGWTLLSLESLSLSLEDIFLKLTAEQEERES